VLSRLALEQERILNPVLDRVRTADHHQLRSLTGLIRNLSRHARNKDEMCECRGGAAARSRAGTLHPFPPVTSGRRPAPSRLPTPARSRACGSRPLPSDQTPPAPCALPPAPPSRLALSSSPNSSPRR